MVGINVALKQLSVLHHNADAAAQGAQVDPLQILAVVINGALLRLFKAQEQTKQRGFPAAGPADDGDILPRTDLERKIVEDQRHIFVVPEGDVVQLDAAGQPLDDLLAVRDLGDRVKKRLDHRENGPDLRRAQRDPGERQKRAGDHAVGRVEGIVIRHRQAGSY